MMLASFRSIADAILGKVPGKPDRADTATRMWLDAGFSGRGEGERSERRPTRGPASADDPLAELRRIVKDRQQPPGAQQGGCARSTRYSQRATPP